MLTKGSILIPYMPIVTSDKYLENDFPPEIELKFECEYSDNNQDASKCSNWQLQFVYNQVNFAYDTPSYSYFSIWGILIYLSKCNEMIVK